MESTNELKEVQDIIQQIDLMANILQREYQEISNPQIQSTRYFKNFKISSHFFHQFGNVFIFDDWIPAIDFGKTQNDDHSF